MEERLEDELGLDVEVVSEEDSNLSDAIVREGFSTFAVTDRRDENGQRAFKRAKTLVRKGIEVDGERLEVDFFRVNGKIRQPMNMHFRLYVEDPENLEEEARSRIFGSSTKAGDEENLTRHYRSDQGE